MEVIHWRTTQRLRLAHWPTSRSSTAYTSTPVTQKLQKITARAWIRLSSGFKTLDRSSTDSLVVPFWFCKSKVQSPPGSVLKVQAIALFCRNATSCRNSFACSGFQGNASIRRGSNQGFGKQQEDHLSQSVSLISRLSAKVPVKILHTSVLPWWDLQPCEFSRMLAGVENT